MGNTQKPSCRRLVVGLYVRPPSTKDKFLIGTASPFPSSKEDSTLRVLYPAVRGTVCLSGTRTVTVMRPNETAFLSPLPISLSVS